MRFLPAPPSGEPEWVELRNDASQASDISGWKIDDAEGGSTPFILPAGRSIGVGAVVRVSLTHSMLNNAGDVVRLLAPDGTVVETVRYAASATGIALCHANNSEQAQACDSIQGAIQPTATAPRSFLQPSATAIPEQLPETLAKSMSHAKPYQNALAGTIYRGVATPTTTPINNSVAPSAMANTPSGSRGNNWFLYAALTLITAAAIVFWRMRRPLIANEIEQPQADEL